MSWYALCYFHARLNKLKTSVFSKGSLFSSKIQNNLFKLQYEESFQHKEKQKYLHSLFYMFLFMKIKVTYVYVKFYNCVEVPP